MIRIDHSPLPEDDIVIPLGDYRLQVISGSGVPVNVGRYPGDLLAAQDGRMMVIDSSGVPREVRPHNHGSGISHGHPFETPFVALRPASITPPESEGTVSSWFTRIMDLF
jgi:hypothetical protein